METRQGGKVAKKCQMWKLCRVSFHWLGISARVWSEGHSDYTSPIRPQECLDSLSWNTNYTIFCNPRKHGILRCGLQISPLHGLWNPEVQCRIHKGSPIIPTLSRINPIPYIDAYFFKIHSNIVLPSTLGLPKCLFPVGVPVKALKALLTSSILGTLPVHLNLLDFPNFNS